MSIYEEFMNFLQKEFGLKKHAMLSEHKHSGKSVINIVPRSFPRKELGIEKSPVTFPKIKTLLAKPKKLLDLANTRAEQHRAQWETETPKINKGGQGSGRKASPSSKLASPKRGSPIKVAISRYQKRPSPSLHQKVVEAFRGKERKKEKPYDPLAGFKHPWD